MTYSTMKILWHQQSEEIRTDRMISAVEMPIPTSEDSSSLRDGSEDDAPLIRNRLKSLEEELMRLELPSEYARVFAESFEEWEVLCGP